MSSPAFFDFQAEASCLAAALREPASAREVCDALRPNDFHDEANRAIFRAIESLLRRNITPDEVLVMEAEPLHAVFTGELSEFKFQSGLLTEHIALVKEKSARRQIADIGRQLYEAAAKGAAASDLLSTAEQNFTHLRNRTTPADWMPIAKVAPGVIADMDYRTANPYALSGLSTGMERIDRLLNGLEPETMTILAARPSMGKTALLLSIAKNMAFDGGKIGIFSLEMSRYALTRRLLANEAQVGLSAIRSGRISEWERHRVVQAQERLSRLSLSIDDTRGLSVSQVEPRARRLKSELGGLDALFVDYLQIAEGIEGKRYGSRENEVSEIAKKLRDISKSLGVPIVVLAQLSREVERRENKRPILSDLKESGGIEAHADAVAFLYRDSYYAAKTEEVNPPDWRDEVEFGVEKNREGETGFCRVAFAPAYSRFDTLVEGKF